MRSYSKMAKHSRLVITPSGMPSGDSDNAINACVTSSNACHVFHAFFTNSCKTRDSIISRERMKHW